jgi:hypothetical protein
MSDPSLALQVALVKALKDDSALTTLIGKRVYDSVPATGFPYVSLGADQVLPDKAGCIDGSEISVQIDAWSRTNGYAEVKRIGAAVSAALDDRPEALDVGGYTVVVFELEASHYLIDPDGLTHHAALTFRALLQLA